jgi:hypothetical protein
MLGDSRPFCTFCTIGLAHGEPMRRQVLRLEMAAVGLAGVWAVA